MTMLTLLTKVSIVLVVLVMAAIASSSQNNRCLHGDFMAINAFKIFVLPVQLEAGFVMIEIPAFPITGVVAIITTRSQCAFVDVLLFVAGPAIRFGFLEHNSEMAFFALRQ